MVIKSPDRHNPHPYQIGIGLENHGSSIQHDAMYALNNLVGSVFIKQGNIFNI